MKHIDRAASPAVCGFSRLVARRATLLFVIALCACTPPEPMAGVDIVGFNHTPNRSLYFYTVDGNMGSGMGPGEGGGKFSCCAEIPERWRPGIKLRIWWDYQGGTSLPPEPPPHEAVVEVPEYKPREFGALHVHFYPDQRIKVFVTDKGANHPDYPADLRWGAGVPADAVAGTALPYDVEEVSEIPGFDENHADVPARVAREKLEATAKRDAKEKAFAAEKAALAGRSDATIPLRGPLPSGSRYSGRLP